jgi:hypothetical protein
MPINKSAKMDDQNNDARFLARSRTPGLNKMARLPASLNRINKNLP